jgi:hypothetical protein
MGLAELLAAAIVVTPATAPASLRMTISSSALGWLGQRNPTLDPRMGTLNLTSDDKRALVAFLKALSGTVTEGF